MNMDINVMTFHRRGCQLIQREWKLLALVTSAGNVFLLDRYQKAKHSLLTNMNSVRGIQL